ncbi:MAG: UDP-N-acetylmuramoyl-L-alanine--D-glutamate ligase [Candidatus Omnitrophota bacterium]
MSLFQNKNITVIGMGRSGLSAAKLLKAKGARVSVSDGADMHKHEAVSAELKAMGIGVELGRHSRSFIEGRDMVVVSPGVAFDALPCLWAQELGVEIISEIELGFLCCPAEIIAITGTNGKTTTTTLIYEVLKASGRRAYCAGNIGTPFTQEVLSMGQADYVSLEVSSFQLERIKKFRPKVSVILNVTPDHMDRYASMDEYCAAKKRIFLNQGVGDWLIVNGQDEALKRMSQDSRAQVFFFDRSGHQGKFNQNQLAVLAVAKVLGISEDVVLGVFEAFKGVEHRMEYVGQLEGVEFINDSKATNIDSTIWALNNIKRPAVLIAGGRDKGSDFSGLRDLVRQKVRSVVLVGEASEQIYSAWKGVLPCHKVKKFEEAVELAYQSAKTGECVLLSPMCKSFDMFADYEHRGRIFKDIVNHLCRDNKCHK